MAAAGKSLEEEGLISRKSAGEGKLNCLDKKNMMCKSIVMKKKSMLGNWICFCPE
jgi:hypothetical protein